MNACASATGSNYLNAMQVPEPPYAGWSPIPNQIPPIESPILQGPCCPLLPLGGAACGTGKCVVPAQQPVVPVPVYQEIQKRDRIIEVPQTIITDKVVPKLYQQEVCYEVPNVNVTLNDKNIQIPRVEFREKIIDVPVPVGRNYKVVAKWEIREVPKLVPKYIGEQEEIFIEVPQVQIVDKNVDKEVPVYVGEKIVRKDVIEEETVDVVQYQYVERQEPVPVYKYKPVFDVEVDIPPPLIVPVALQPKEVRLEPERISLSEWKQLKLGGASNCCNEYGCLGPNQTSVGAKCFSSCQPGGVCSPAGSCGSVCQAICCCKCRETGVCVCESCPGGCCNV